LSGQFAWQLTNLPVINFLVTVITQNGLQKLGKAVKIQQTYNRRDFSKLILIFGKFSGKLPISAPYKLSYYTLWLRVRTGERM